MTTTEIATVFKKSGEERLALFIDAVVKNKSVFGISDDEGWALLGDNDDTDILPLFQDAALAEAFRKSAGFEGHEIEEVELEELLEWLQELDEDGAMIAVCPNTHFEGAILEPGQLMADLIGK
ncbi:MAG: DUF2750 domain-containing protein [Saprospiraceae bacterium]